MAIFKTSIPRPLSEEHLLLATVHIPPIDPRRCDRHGRPRCLSCDVSSCGVGGGMALYTYKIFCPGFGTALIYS